MSKVTGPLHSDVASGKVAKCLVFSTWKGQPYVRGLVTPKNAMSEDQGDFRLILGGTGKAAKPVDKTSNVVTALKTITTGINSWVSNFVKAVCKNYMVDATAFEAIVTAYTAHTDKTSFISNAATLGMTDFDVAYKGTTNKYTAGMQLYVLAKYLVDVQGSNPDLLASDPFDTALADWTGSEITAMLAEIAPQP